MQSTVFRLRAKTGAGCLACWARGVQLADLADRRHVSVGLDEDLGGEGQPARARVVQGSTVPTVSGVHLQKQRVVENVYLAGKRGSSSRMVQELCEQI